jgi:hypothetical protein
VRTIGREGSSDSGEAGDDHAPRLTRHRSFVRTTDGAVGTLAEQLVMRLIGACDDPLVWCGWMKIELTS